MARIFLSVVLITTAAFSQAPDQRRLKGRDEVAAPAQPSVESSRTQWVVGAGTRIPIQLRQPLSTKTAQVGDPVYAQTAFPVVANSTMIIPAGTWVQGTVDMVKRAGRIKGTAELQFHLTKLIYPNGYTLDVAAAIANVPGDAGTTMKEPGTVAHQPEKGTDLERIGSNASRGAMIGSVAGAAANPSIRGLGVGGLAGVAAGTLIAVLARGSDVLFPTGTSVEIALSQAIAIDRTATGQAIGPPVLPPPVLQ
jgi:hypothetical protein